MAGQEHQADGGDDRRQREKHRQQRCGERSECEQQDEHGRGDREDLGAVQVAVGRVHGDVAETRRAELGDPEPCVGPLRGGHSVEHGADTHRAIHHLAADLEGDECGVTIAGDELRGVERRPYVRDVLLRADGRDRCPDRRLEGWVIGGVGAALDQDVFARLVAESGPVEDSLGGGGVACERVGHGEVA